jgi:hypothetical protein
MNGADDDGSGTRRDVEIAEQFAKEKPARSIVFVSHEGEEAVCSVRGGSPIIRRSRWRTSSPRTIMDMLGKGRVDEVKFGGPTSVQLLGARRLSRDFGDIIDSVNATRVETMAIDKSWEVLANPMNRFCRSDQVNYVRQNIPVTYFSLGYALDYHQPTDEPQYIRLRALCATCPLHSRRDDGHRDKEGQTGHHGCRSRVPAVPLTQGSSAVGATRCGCRAGDM